MTQTSDAIKKARMALIQQTLDKICKVRDIRELKTSTHVILMHLWIHKKAEEESLFEGDEWAHPECRDELLKKIKEFLEKHIR